MANLPHYIREIITKHLKKISFSKKWPSLSRSFILPHIYYLLNIYVKISICKYLKIFILKKFIIYMVIIKIQHHEMRYIDVYIYIYIQICCISVLLLLSTLHIFLHKEIFSCRTLSLPRVTAFFNTRYNTFVIRENNLFFY